MLNRRQLLVALGASGTLTASLAQSRGTQKQAMVMTQEAATFLKTNGRDKLIERVMAKDAQFVNGDLYVVVLDLGGTHLAHPTNPGLVGKALLDQPDPEGKMFRQERVDLAAKNGRGWIDYKYKNPVDGKLEQKTAYVLKVGDTLVSVGAYKDVSGTPPQ